VDQSSLVGSGWSTYCVQLLTGAGETHTRLGKARRLVIDR
jgi:hypothetical protein